jgi:hypothetical protein
VGGFFAPAHEAWSNRKRFHRRARARAHIGKKPGCPLLAGMVRAKSTVVGTIDRFSIGTTAPSLAHDECDFVPSALDRRKLGSNHMIGREVAS